MIKRQTSLSGNIVAFCRHLRAHGFFIGTHEEKDSLIAIELLEPYQAPELFELCLQTTLCKTQRQLQKFPKLYKTYWKELDRAIDSKVEDKEEQTKKNKTNDFGKKAPSIQVIKNWLYGNKQEDETEAAAYSSLEVMGRSTFPGFEDRELKDIFKLVQRLVKKIANRRSRRFSSSHRKAQIDLKKTIRKNILKNGELIDIAYKAKKKEHLRVVLLCDVSKSMELYSRFLIQFMYAFQNLFPKIQTFVFSTTLHHVTEDLHDASIDRSLEKVLDKVNNWSGGTRIGSALENFYEQYAHRHLTSKTLVMILSDGWDTGEAELMAEQMKKIQRKALKVIWLNPLAGSSDWQPEVVGMKAAMPYIDALLPFHNIESLRSVVKHLKI